MNMQPTSSSGKALAGLQSLLPEVEALYTDVHAHPEQTIVSRELAATEAAVVTIGSLQAGTKENVIPDDAVIKLNVRIFDAGVRKRVLAAIERIVNAEAAASGAPRAPEITTLDHYPLNVNDAGATSHVVEAFRKHFSAERIRQTGAAPASEDFGSF